MKESMKLVNREDQAVLASISDQEFFSNLATLGSYTVPASGSEGQCATLTVFGRTELYDLGDDRKGERYWSARQIAQSILAEHNPDADLRRYGVFLCAGNKPTEEEIEAGRERRNSFYLDQVQQADTTYARWPNRPELITDVQRRAAKALGLDRPWLVKIAPMTECPACGEAVKHGVALCRHCGAVLDERKAARFGIIRMAAPQDSSGTATAREGFARPGGLPAKGEELVSAGPGPGAAPGRATAAKGNTKK